VRKTTTLVGWGSALAAILSVRPALGFCRTTTCDPTSDDVGCAVVDGCETQGQPLFWADACVTYAVQERGSALRGITAYELDLVMQKAFASWLGTDCPQGGKPSLGVIPLGGASCDQTEFNRPQNGRAGAPNANIVMFRDDRWPYPGQDYVIARTSITYDPNSGAIFDADIEINSHDNEFSTDDDVITNDLQAVLTHEVGHFIGLDHSTFPGATMQSNYDLFNLSARTLSSDDEAGVCSIYAPDPDFPPGCPADTSPRHGYSRECGSDAAPDAGCGLATGSGQHTHLWLSCGLLAWARRRKRCTR